MPVTQRRHPAATAIALILVLAATAGLAALVSQSRLAKAFVALAGPRTFGTLSVSLPSGWEPIDAKSSILLVALKEPGVAPAAPKERPAHRAIYLSVAQPEHALPPAQYLSQVRQTLPENFIPVSFGPFPGLSLRLQNESAYKLFGVSTLPSGRIVVLQVEGPGYATKADFKLFTDIAASVSFSDESPQFAVQDALDNLRNRTVASPVTQLNAGRATDRSSLSQTFIVSTPPNDITTLEIHPIYIPPIPKAPANLDPTADPATSNEESLGAAAWVAQCVGAQQTPAFRSASVKRLAARRALLTPPLQPSEPPILGLLVWSDNSSDIGAFLVARGAVGSEATLNRLLNRAADLLTFDRKPEEFGELVADGVRVARESARALAAATDKPEDYAILWSDKEDHALGWTQVSANGSIETRRDEVPGGIARRTRLDSHGLFGTSFTRGAWTGSVFSDAVSDPITFRVGVGVTEEQAEKDPGQALLRRGPYLSADRLLSAIPLTRLAPAIFLTNTVPWLDIETFPVYWLVVTSPVPNQPRAWYLHPLGSGSTFVARYDEQNRLQELSLLGGPKGTVIRPATLLDQHLPTEGPLAR